MTFNVQRLVGGDIPRFDKGAVVGGNNGDVGVFAGTELGMAIAGLRIDDWGGRGGGSRRASGIGRGIDEELGVLATEEHRHRVGDGRDCGIIGTG